MMSLFSINIIDSGMVLTGSIQTNTQNYIKVEISYATGKP